MVWYLEEQSKFSYSQANSSLCLQIIYFTQYTKLFLSSFSGWHAHGIVYPDWNFKGSVCDVLSLLTTLDLICILTIYQTMLL